MALLEMEAVKQAAGAEPVGEAEKCLAAGTRAALATGNIQATDAEAIMAIALDFYMKFKTGGGGAAVIPEQAAGMSSAPGWNPSGMSIPQRLTAERAGRFGRGRSLSRQTPVPRSSSASRSPKGRQEEY